MNQLQTVRLQLLKYKLKKPGSYVSYLHNIVLDTQVSAGCKNKSILYLHLYTIYTYKSTFFLFHTSFCLSCFFCSLQSVCTKIILVENPIAMFYFLFIFKLKVFYLRKKQTQKRKTKETNKQLQQQTENNNSLGFQNKIRI